MPRVNLQIALFPFTVLVLAVAAHAADSGVLRSIEEAYKAKEMAKVIQLADEAVGSETDSAILVRLHYFLAKAVYEMTAADIKACREDKTIEKGRLRTDQADAMKKAVGHFKAVYDLDPDSTLAPESLFMTGRIYDYGCLNHFDEAAAQYDICRKRYPDDQYGKLSEARYMKLKPRLDTGMHGHGGS